MDDVNTDEHDVHHTTEPTPCRRTPWNTISGRVICLVSRKGGVGKTTSAVNLGAALALSGHTVLIVGTDPQCGVCRSLGSQPHELPHGLEAIFTDDAGAPGQSLTDLALPSPLDNLYYVAPRVMTLAEEESHYANFTAQADIFVGEIDRARNLYDTILIDCPPSLGPATQAALLAADGYLVPVQAEELCLGSVASLLDFVNDFTSHTHQVNQVGGIVPASAKPLALEGLFLTMASNRTRMGRHVAAKVSEDFGEHLFSAGIPRTTRLSEMALRGKPTVIYDRRSPGSRAYFDLADEIVNRYASHTDNADSLIDAMIAAMAQPLADEKASVETPFTTACNQDIGEPEIVSLDDLLAEEESRSGNPREGDWEDGYWSGEGGRYN